MVQISVITRLTSHYSNWKFVDIYIDIASGKTKSSRKEFSRMLEDIKKEDVNIILTKSVSRLGSDTVMSGSCPKDSCIRKKNCF